MVKAVEYASDYEQKIASERKYVSKFLPPTKKPKPLWIKNAKAGQPPVQKTAVFDLFQKYEGSYKSPESAPEDKGVPFYSLYKELTGYVRRVQIIPADPKKKKEYADIEFLIEDSEDGEFFKIETFEDSGASNHYCVSLNDPRADYSKPFTFSCYKKEGTNKTGGKEVYMNYNVSQSHLPLNSWGMPGTLYMNVREQMPTYYDRKAKKDVSDWTATEWGELAQFFDAKYTNLPVRVGMIASINDKAIAALGQPPSEAEIMQSLLGSPSQDDGYDGDYDDSDEGGYYEEPLSVDSVFPLAATTQLNEGETFTDRLKALSEQTGWNEDQLTEMFLFFGVEGTRREKKLVDSGRINEAIAYVEDSLALYHICDFLVTDSATEEDLVTIGKMKEVALTRKVIKPQYIKDLLVKAKDVQSRQPKKDEFEDIPF